jgi:hypothetical protein
MALFADGPASGIEDLAAQDSQLLNVASAEGIDLTAKLALAQETIGVELEGLLQECSGPELRQVVVTPALRLWHTYRTLETVYRDAYYNQLNDRYAGKRDQFRELGMWARERVRETGVGLAWRPVRRAATPDARPAAGSLPEGTYYVTIAWVNSAGEEGRAAIPAAVATVSGGGFLVVPPSAPEDVAGWNVYVGAAPESMARQNGAALSAEAPWLQTEIPGGGSAPGDGQKPNHMQPLPRRLQRG